MYSGLVNWLEKWQIHNFQQKVHNIGNFTYKKYMFKENMLK